ncbi:MAG TPA: ABC transporter ATP-binding protein [Spirochaetes bacterium]|nr:ABC transporter ATP-binding protein [Spirochaetota bacterium]
MAEVKLSSLTKNFGDITAVDNMDLEIKDKEFFVLLGPTGAGKSTTLRLVAGLEIPDEGEVFLEGNNVNELSPASRDVAFVFQYYTLYPNYTVRKNLEFPLRSDLRKLSEEEITNKVAEVARVLHIEHLLDRGTVNLSGGEMQRVAIGRAIVRSPKVFLMDEPLSNLDAKLREEMRAELSRLHYDLGSTFFYVTHDQIEAMTMGDRVAVLNEGKILQIGTPDEIYNSPGDIFVAKFVGSPKINLMDASVDGRTLIAGEKALVFHVSDKHGKLLEKYGKRQIILGIRPEDIEISKEKKGPNPFGCRIHFKQSLGVEDVYNLKIDNTMFKATAPTKIMAKVGETVYANINMERAHLFDPDTERRIV